MTASALKPQLRHALLSKLNSKRSGKQNALQKGFTLVELMVVIVIVGILSAVALPSLLGNKELAARNAARNVLSTSAKACQAAIVGGDATLNPDIAQAKVPDATFSIDSAPVTYSTSTPEYAPCVAADGTPTSTDIVLAATPPTAYSKWTTIETATIKPGGQVEYCWTDNTCEAPAPAE